MKQKAEKLQIALLPHRSSVIGVVGGARAKSGCTTVLWRTLGGWIVDREGSAAAPVPSAYSGVKPGLIRDQTSSTKSPVSSNANY
jgi:hypothetical protein